MNGSKNQWDYAENQGHEAWARGDSVSDNPNTALESVERDGWISGFERARREDYAQHL
jgi:hypothetical protein